MAASLHRGQASLESLVLLAGLFAFVGVLWSASKPLQDASMQRAVEVNSEASFEPLRFAVQLASVSAPGFSLRQDWHLRQNATVRWGSDALIWRSGESNRTLDAPFFSSGQLDLAAGRHILVVRRQADGIEWGVD